jgi:serine protease Do
MARKDAVLALRQILIKRRDALRKALAGDLSLLKELRGQTSGDVVDAALDTAQDEISSQLAEVESRELASIENALEQMRNGSYGVCEGCEEAIPLARLQALPYAVLCIECQREAEKRGEFNRGPQVPGLFVGIRSQLGCKKWHNAGVAVSCGWDRPQFQFQPAFIGQRGLVIGHSTGDSGMAGIFQSCGWGRIASLRAIAPSRIAVLCLWTATLCLAGPARAQDDEELISADARAKMFAELNHDVDWLERQGNVLKRVVKLVKPNVVHIEAAKTEADNFRPGRKNSVEEAGSGVIIELANKPYILTNRHVVADAQLRDIKIRLSDGRQITPTKVWSDRGTDIAILQMDAQNLIPVRVGDSNKLEIGDFVLAVGSPFGLSHSVTYGIISAKGRRDLELGDDNVRFQDFIQTDAAINPGNSGGPLLNLRGEIVGINTAIASSSGGSEGIGFTIPINMAMHVAQQLIERGVVSRAFFGVHLDSKFTPDVAARLGLATSRGARVSGITPNSPASTAKIVVGDVVLSYNGERIHDDNHLVNLVSVTPVGKDVPIVVYREGKTLNITVRVGDRKQFEPEKEK